MLLAVDVGNTQTVYGLYDGERLAEHWRVTTEAERTGDELGVLVGRLLELRDVGFEDIGGVCLSSTVPPLIRAYEEFARDYAEAPLLVLGPGTRTGIPIVLRRPARGRPRPHRQRGRGARALRGALHRRRLRHVHELRHRLRATGSTSAASSRRGSRSRWRRSSPAPRGW